MLRIHQFGSLEALITTIQIPGIYGKNPPKTNLKHAAQLQDKTTSCPLYIQLKSTEHQ